MKYSRTTKRLVALLSSGWSIWAPRRAGSAWLCPPGDKGPCKRVRFSTLDAAVAEGAITTESTVIGHDTFWVLSGDQS